MSWFYISSWIVAGLICLFIVPIFAGQEDNYYVLIAVIVFIPALAGFIENQIAKTVYYETKFCVLRILNKPY